MIERSTIEGDAKLRTTTIDESVETCTQTRTHFSGSASLDILPYAAYAINPYI